MMTLMIDEDDDDKGDGDGKNNKDDSYKRTMTKTMAKIEKR